MEELGVDVNVRDHNGYNAIHHAASRGDDEVIRYLFEKGGDVTAVSRKDQTLTAHGFSDSELTQFARSLHGRGIDRIVPFGQALSFGSLWDGYDLLAELTRTINVSPRISSTPMQSR